MKKWECLTEREWDILKLRYGNKRYTLRDVGILYFISRERVRQIEYRALGKIGLDKNQIIEYLKGELNEKSI